MLERAIRLSLIDQTEPDKAGARELLADARRHLTTASAAADTDPNGSYQLAYDAARKAIAAHMLGHGYRVVRGRPGAHETTGRYGISEIADDEHFRAFDRMRRARNRTEYGPAHIGVEQLHEDIAHAESIVDTVEEHFITGD